MKAEFKSSFLRDLKAIKDQALLSRIRTTIEEIELAPTIQEINNLTKLRGANNYFRVRVGDYRLGLLIENETVVFVRCLNRREIYRYFP
jgi:mRNA interferase RelE/StbE